MIAVIFEVVPFLGERHRYLDLAGDLRAHLEATDGFISVERFESLTTRGKLLSLSFWRDEEACAAGARRKNTALPSPPAVAASSPPTASASPKCSATTALRIVPRPRRTVAPGMGEAVF